jgi:hypothetical protein
MAKKTKEEKDAAKAALAAKRATKKEADGGAPAEVSAQGELTAEQERVAAARAVTGDAHHRA